MDTGKLAETWRARNGYTGKKGVIVIYAGVVNSWLSELREPERWIPGCIAVDEDGNRWVAVGGDVRNGAQRWEPMPGIQVSGRK